MKLRIVWNDLKANRLMSFATWAFMAVCALLVALTCFLFSGLLGSIDVLMDTAKTPDFLQMHAGEWNGEALSRFALAHEEVQDYQVLSFLNLENASITLGGRSLSDSTQDNGVCVQSEAFDFLVDLDNRLITVSPGEIYVPVCYRQMYGLRVGDSAVLHGERLVIAGFLRDSQMNAMMSSSKRFLVNSADYERLLASGSEEYLIEFLLRDGADSNVFATAYADAGLPANGPAITRPLMKMMNALSDGLLALMILLVSVVMLLISLLCIRFTLLSQLEGDRREIGMLKAIGIGRRDVRRLYFAKYLALSLLGAAFGLAAAWAVKGPLQSGMQELYGAPPNGAAAALAALLGTLVTEGVILLSVFRTLRRTERMTAVEALTGRGEDRRRALGQPLYVLVAFVIACCVFLMTVPQNLSSTISSRGFVTYMGIGNGEVRLDIRQTDDIAGKTQSAADMLAKDERVGRFTSLMTKTYRIVPPGAEALNLNVEMGDHTAFPVSYAEGHAPREADEIALSYLCAREFGVHTGDEVQMLADGNERRMKVCGIYSDITSGGKTAKACMLEDGAPVMWSVFYLSLRDADQKAWMDECEQKLGRMGINAKVVDIDAFVQATYGPTMGQIALAARAAILSAMAVMLVVVALFANMLVARDRNEISLRKAIGFAGWEIKAAYAGRLLGIACGGIVLGIALGNLLGEIMVGMALQSLGACGFRFQVNGWSIYVLTPLLSLAAVALALAAGLGEIKAIRAWECCVGKE